MEEKMRDVETIAEELRQMNGDIGLVSRKIELCFELMTSYCQKKKGKRFWFLSWGYFIERSHCVYAAKVLGNMQHKDLALGKRALKFTEEFEKELPSKVTKNLFFVAHKMNKPN
ncbi:hypothetical protein KKA39_02830 [Patescibacteria group bacterium]|nr:hypothetical protein [Patescibacteria group bacterium]MBU1728211.1 hypothetical protein [Patescibacteria group bacterium]